MNTSSVFATPIPINATTSSALPAFVTLGVTTAPTVVAAAPSNVSSANVTPVSVLLSRSKVASAVLVPRAATRPTAKDFLKTF